MILKKISLRRHQGQYMAGFMSGSLGDLADRASTCYLDVGESIICLSKLGYLIWKVLVSRLVVVATLVSGPRLHPDLEQTKLES